MSSPADSAPPLVKLAVRDFRSSWRSLFLTDVAFKVIAFIVLTPLVSFLFHVLLAASGNAVLSDTDILFYFLGPLGWLCLILVGAVWLGIIALEQASLLAVVCASDAQRRLESLGALRFAAVKAVAVLKVTARIVALTGLAVAPFLVVAGMVYFALLTEYDISFYLQEQPPAFTTAVVIGGVLAVGLAAVLLRLATSWFLALPILLFEDVKPSAALVLSAQRARGQRFRLLLWILAWFLATTAISIVVTGAIGLLGRLIIPSSTASLQLLAVTVGLVLLCLMVVGLTVNLLSTTSFAVIVFRLYQQCGGAGGTSEMLSSLKDEKLAGPAFQITRKRLLIAGVVGVIIAIGIGVSALRSVRLDDNVQIMAHRGSSTAAPENTMAAIGQAIADGADWVEIDVQETADGEVVVFHDSDFMKVAGRNLKIWDATMEDLREIDIGSWFDPQFKDERVPTLADVLDACHGTIGVNIELKYYGHDEQLEQRVVDIVETHDMADQVMVMSLKMDAVKKMKSIRPDWKVGLLMSVAAGNIKNIEADFLAVNASFANPNLIRTAHNCGKEVYVWTVNDGPTMSTMISRGVDGLLTDKPALARTVLEQRAQMSAPERLLLEIAGELGATPELGEP